MDTILLLLNVLLLIQPTVQQTTVTKQVVEGVNINIDILCDLDRELHPVYWKIQEQVYDPYELPDIFTLRGHEAITLETVDRRMDGWRLQCFSIDHARPGGLTPGGITILRVIVINTGVSIEPADLLPPSHQGKLTLYFQNLQIRPDTLTIKWLYPPDPSTRACIATEFRTDIYSASQINDATIEPDLVPRQSFNTSSTEITLSTDFLTNFFRIYAQDDVCPESAYFYDLYFTDTVPDIFVDGSTASFEIPENLLNNRSVQLIWPKDVTTQCVCPPVQQFMASCACNIRHPSNMVTIVNNTLIISNIQEISEESITFYFVFSTSGGCHGSCNLRYIVRKQRIIVAEGFPMSPTLVLMADNTFCFTIPDNPISAEVYEVELTDITGSQTRLSEDYSTSTCLNITSDQYPEVCGPFNLSVTAVNSVGRAGTTHTINGMQEPNLCRCYVEKEKLAIQDIRPSSNSVEFHVSCADEAILTIIQTNLTSANRGSVPCNSTVTIMDSIESLMPSTNYTIYGIFVNQQGTETVCPLDSFRTNGNGGTIIIISTIVPIVIIIIGLVILLVLYILKKACPKESKSDKPEVSGPKKSELKSNQAKTIGDEGGSPSTQRESNKPPRPIPPNVLDDQFGSKEKLVTSPI